MKNAQFSELAQSVLELDRSLDQLRILAETCGVPSPEHESWYALLKHKLVPQLSDRAFLIVAVMGGTNTGKSLIFNHLVGEHFSGVDHRASGTKHPVCLVPKASPELSGIASIEAMLARQFDSFKLVSWSDAKQALTESETHHLFWKEGEHVPERLLLLDTPDVDSDREVNWDRAKAVRHAADVLIAVLTEQKYNDAAVRRFFREAAKAKKPIIVLFNMFDLDEDVKHLSRWIEQFCEEINEKPVCVIVSPHDRPKAETLNVPFYLVSGIETDEIAFGQPIDLGEVLNDLHFDEIKTQTLLGALDVLDDPATGVCSYLKTVEATSKRFADALNTLETVNETTIDWPGMPTPLLVEEIRGWWHDGRPGWSQGINDGYRKVGGVLFVPVKKATRYISCKYFGAKATPDDPLNEFHDAENDAMLHFVEKVVQKLEKLAETDNPVLRRELLELVDGEHRAALIDRARNVLTQLEPIDVDFRQTLRKHLDDWAEKNPKAVGWIRSLDHVGTVARPVITVSLVITGVGLGGEALTQALGGVVVAAGGETVLHAGSEGTKYGTAKLFRQIQKDFVVNRSRRFLSEFQKELWKEVIDRLRTGAEVVDSDVFRRCRNWSRNWRAK